MKSNFIHLLIVLSFVSGSSFATEYVYRDLKANTLPSIKCKAKSDAVIDASKPYSLERSIKKFCQTQGYGWHVEKVIDEGQPVCDECEGYKKGKYQCHLQDVVVACKRIRPGSVGLLPGQGT